MQVGFGSSCLISQKESTCTCDGMYLHSVMSLVSLKAMGGMLARSSSTTHHAFSKRQQQGSRLVLSEPTFHRHLSTLPQSLLQSMQWESISLLVPSPLSPPVSLQLQLVSMSSHLCLQSSPQVRNDHGHLGAALLDGLQYGSNASSLVFCCASPFCLVLSYASCLRIVIISRRCCGQ